MSKYTKEQLKEMATETLEALEQGEFEAMVLISQVSFVTRLPQNEVVRRIKELAI